MILPAFGGAPGQRNRIFGLWHTIANPRTASRIVQPGTGRSDLRGCGEQFLHLLPVDPEVGKPPIRHPPPHPFQPADRLILPQGTRVEVEPFDNLHQHAGDSGR